MEKKDNGKITDAIRDDLKKSLKKKDKKRISVLRMMLNALNNKKIEKGEELSRDDELAELSSYARKRKESIKEYLKGGRDDLVEEEKGELEIVMSYLPQQLSEEEIEREAGRIIEELDAGGMSDMGKVMGKMMSEFKGRADGRMVNRIVSRMLKD